MHTASPSSTIETQFEQALDLQKQGNNEAALRIYQKILLANSGHAKSLQMIGLLLAQSGRYRQARKFLRLALDLSPDNADIRTNHACVLGKLGDSDSCLAGLHQVIEQFPERAEAFYQLGHHYRKAKDLENAVEYFSHAIAIDDQHADALLECAQALQQLGMNEVALQCCEQADVIAPRLTTELAFCRGQIFESLGQAKQAIAAYRQAISANQENLLAAQGLVRMLHASGQVRKANDQAKSNAQRCLQRATACCAIARKLLKEKEYESALDYLDEAVLFQPTSRPALILRGKVLNLLERPKEALSAIESATALGGEDFVSCMETAAILRNLNRFDESLQILERTTSLRPESSELLINKAQTLLQMHQLDAALDAIDQALKKNPEEPDFLFQKALILLLKGDLPEGFRFYEYRWQSKQLCREKPNYPQAQWTGEQSLLDKTILLHAEQGLGDTLQFCRYIRLIKPLAGRIIFAVRKELLTLMQQFNDVAEVVTLNAPPTDFDFYCPLLSLPTAFATRLDSIPNWPSYLNAAPDKIAHWTGIVGATKKTQMHSPRIGLVWQGNPQHVNDVRRSIPLALMLAALPKGYEYICLQKDLSQADRHYLAESPPAIRMLSETLHDYSDTAALCSQLDLVISVDTSIAHLAGALGKPTLLLLPHTPDWRWLLDRQNSPWYPSLSLLRQTEVGNWDSALVQLPQQIEQILDGVS